MKTALVLFGILMLVSPVSVLAADDDLVTRVWDFPNRAVTEITSWYTATRQDRPTPAQVLGIKDFSNGSVIEDKIVKQEISTKIDSTGSALDQLYLDFQQVLSETILIGLQWDNLTVSDVTQATDKQNGVLTKAATSIDWLSQSWGWSDLDDVKAQANQVQSNLVTIRSIVSTSGMQPIAYEQLKTTAQELEAITQTIGNKTDAGSGQSLYSQFNKILSMKNQLDDLRAQLGAELLNPSDISQTTKLQAQLMAINQVPNASEVLASDANNKILGLLALIEANKLLLAQDRGVAFAHTWLEESPDGKLIFKTMVSNPSLVARQEVFVKYYLPGELREDDITSHDNSLRITLDEEADRLLVEGSLVVAAGDTRTMALESTDLWKFDEVALDALHFQTIELMNSLVHTTSFVEAAFFRANVDALYAHAKETLGKDYPPEERIRAYRSVAVQMVDMNKDIVQIQQLVAKSNAAVWPAFSNWQEIALCLGGVMLVLLGISTLKQTSVVTTHKPRHSKTKEVTQFNIFSEGIAASDL